MNWSSFNVIGSKKLFVIQPRWVNLNLSNPNILHKCGTPNFRIEHKSSLGYFGCLFAQSFAKNVGHSTCRRNRNFLTKVSVPQPFTFAHCLFILATYQSFAERSIKLSVTQPLLAQHFTVIKDHTNNLLLQRNVNDGLQLERLLGFYGVCVASGSWPSILSRLLFEFNLCQRALIFSPMEDDLLGVGESKREYSIIVEKRSASLSQTAISYLAVHPMSVLLCPNCYNLEGLTNIWVISISEIRFEPQESESTEGSPLNPTQNCSFAV